MTSPRFALPLLPLLALVAVAAVRPPARVMQKNKTFSQAEIRVRVGDSLTFVNDDDVSHNAFSSTAGLKFNLKRQAPATSLSVSFAHRGKADVRCAFHPNMKLRVIVE